MKQLIAICAVLALTGCSSMGYGPGMQSSGSSMGSNSSSGSSYPSSSSNYATSLSGAPAPPFDPFLYSGG